MAWSVGTDTFAIRRELFLFKISHSVVKQIIHLHNSCTKQAFIVTAFSVVLPDVVDVRKILCLEGGFHFGK
jgi:hypothetical protein